MPIKTLLNRVEIFQALDEKVWVKKASGEVYFFRVLIAK